MSGETDLIERLRAMQAEMIAEGVNGWPNTVETAIEHLSTLEASDADTVRVPCDELRDRLYEMIDGFADFLDYVPAERDQMRGRVRAYVAMLTASHPKPEPVETQAITYADFQQRRGRLPDLIEEALSIYDEFMMDDAYDAQRPLDKIAETLRAARDFYDVETQPEASRSPAPSDRAMVLEEAARNLIERLSMEPEGGEIWERSRRFNVYAQEARKLLSSPPDEGVGSCNCPCHRGKAIMHVRPCCEG